MESSEASGSVSDTWAVWRLRPLRASGRTLLSLPPHCDRTLRYLVLFAIVCAAPAVAQPLVAGTWTGTLDPARGGPVAVEAALEECIGGYKVDLKVGGREVGEAQAVSWADNRLRFRFTEPRSRRLHNCALIRRADGTLAGSCAVARARPAAMVLNPPAAGAFGCTG